MEDLLYFYDDTRHLVCMPYSVDNLHRMAEDLQIKRCWFHGGDKPHYDIPKRRVQEIAERCTKISSRQVLSIILLSSDKDFEKLIKEKIQKDGTESSSD